MKIKVEPFVFTNHWLSIKIHSYLLNVVPLTLMSFSLICNDVSSVGSVRPHSAPHPSPLPQEPFALSRPSTYHESKRMCRVHVVHDIRGSISPCRVLLMLPACALYDLIGVETWGISRWLRYGCIQASVRRLKATTTHGASEKCSITFWEARTGLVVRLFRSFQLCLHYPFVR